MMYDIYVYNAAGDLVKMDRSYGEASLPEAIAYYRRCGAKFKVIDTFDGVVVMSENF